MKEIVKELVDQKEKVVVFTNFVNEGVDKIIKNLKTILQPPADSKLSWFFKTGREKFSR